MNWPGNVVEHLFSSVVEIKNARNNTSTPLHAFIAWRLIRLNDSFAFYLSATNIVSPYVTSELRRARAATPPTPVFSGKPVHVRVVKTNP